MRPQPFGVDQLKPSVAASAGLSANLAPAKPQHLDLCSDLDRRRQRQLVLLVYVVLAALLVLLLLMLLRNSLQTGKPTAEGGDPGNYPHEVTDK